MDRLRIMTDRVFLTDEAAGSVGTVKGFKRRVTNFGPEQASSLILQLLFKEEPLVTVLAHRLDDGRWRVPCLDFNVPRLVFGHNGRPVRTGHNFALALTRLQHFVSQVVRSECHGRIIPGVGTDNFGYIKYIEMMIQIEDPGHKLLVASHLARYLYQHKSPVVCWEQSTRTKRRELSFSFYDKVAQAQGWSVPEGPLTRVECIVTTACRLAKEVMKTQIYQGSPGKVVSTLSWETAYAILRRNLGDFSGFGNLPEVDKSKVCKTTRNLIAGLGNRLTDPHAVDLALEHWKKIDEPKERTLRSVTKELRSFAVASTLTNADEIICPDMADLRWADVRHFLDDEEFGTFIRDAGAPLVPDPEILAAWSQTTLLREKPTCELVGTLFAKGVPGKSNTL